MTKPIVFLAVLALGCAMGLAASAQGASGEAYAATKAECEQQAEAKKFGAHLSERGASWWLRNRFVVRCIAGKSQ